MIGKLNLPPIETLAAASFFIMVFTFFSKKGIYGFLSFFAKGKGWPLSCEFVYMLCVMKH